MTPTEEEILRALGDEELAGFVIANRIEDMWEAEGRRERFLFWSYPASMGYSTIYRVLKRMTADGKVTSRAIPDSQRRRYRATI